MSNVSVSQSLIDDMSRERQEMLRKLEFHTEQLRAAYMSPELLAWRAESQHGFSRVYASDAVQARARGAVAQRCDASKVHVSPWPEEDLCKAAQKDATINALADVLERLWNFSVPRAKTEALWPEVEAALQKAGRLP